MALRDEIMKLLVELRRQEMDAEAEATHAAEALSRLASGLTPLAEVDSAAINAAADTYGDAVQRLKIIEQFKGRLQNVLI